MAKRRRKFDDKWHKLWHKHKPWLIRGFQIVATLFVVIPPLGALVFAVLPVPLTPLMMLRMADGQGLVRSPVPLSKISAELVLAVIASEDSRFCSHDGFDWRAINKAAEANGDGHVLHGASTISQQTVKNVFLWPGRDWIRKGLEAYTTIFVEALWTKPRIMQTYLNVIEWGPGIYGAEAAARYHFGKSAEALTAAEAARLAVILPSPRKWRANPAGPFVKSRASVIEARMDQVRNQGLARCVFAPAH